MVLVAKQVFEYMHKKRDNDYNNDKISNIFSEGDEKKECLK